MYKYTFRYIPLFYKCKTVACEAGYPLRSVPQPRTSYA
jgi:hypothetical protein